jgi:thioredoxin 1
VALLVKPVWDRFVPEKLKSKLVQFWEKLVNLFCSRRNPITKTIAAGPIPGQDLRRKITSEEDYASILNESNKRPVIVKFSADFCAPCKLMDPVVDELARSLRGKVHFADLDIEVLDDIAIKQGVSSIPAFHVIQGGKTVEKLVGANSEKLRDLARKASTSLKDVPVHRKDK